MLFFLVYDVSVPLIHQAERRREKQRRMLDFLISIAFLGSLLLKLHNATNSNLSAFISNIPIFVMVNTGSSSMGAAFHLFTTILKLDLNIIENKICLHSRF